MMWNIYRTVFLISAILLVAGQSALYGDEPRVTAKVNSDRIYIGESVRYRITLQDCDPSVEPQLDQFQNFDVRMLGKSSGSQSITVMTNGKVDTYSQSGPTYEYLLTPKRSGKVLIPPATVEVNGKKYQGPSISLDVLAPDEQDLAILELKPEPAEVYPLQPFTVKLNVAVKALPDPVGDREPVSVQQQLPQLIVPWADDENLPPSVKPVEPAADWLRGLLDKSRNPSGFAINNIRTRGAGSRFGFPDLNELMGGGIPEADSLFSMFREESRAAFHPSPKNTTRNDLKQRKVGYWEYEFNRTFTAEKLGEHTFGPATLKGVFAIRTDTRGDLEGERIYAVAKPISILVKDAPLAGRPLDYIGAIGQFEAGAELSPTEVKVGDPLTLNVWLKGQGTLANMSPPNLTANPVIAASFKIYESTDQTTGDERRFTYSLRPKQTAIQEFPAVAMSYFDVAQEKYVTLKTKPIPIAVAAADQLADADIALPAGSAAESRGPEASAEGVFANITDLTQLRNEAVQPRRYLLLLSSMLGAFFIAVVVSNRVKRSSEDVLGQKRRGAVRRAKQRIAESSGNQSVRSADAISSALRGLVADWIGGPEQSLTTGDVRRHLTNLQIDSKVVDQLAQVLENCDAARYGAQMEPLDRLADQASSLIDELTRELKNCRAAGTS
jgi:hypothetical protein